MTNVLAINGSARMEKGDTQKILPAFLDGMKDAGATTETLFAKRHKIRPCLGDFQCWFEKVGQCIQKDDMEQLLPKFREADILVLAIPIYFPLPGEIQNMLNRLMPLIEPLLEFHDGRTRAKFHDDVKISKIVLVSTGGWWEKENMTLIVDFVDHMAKDSNVEFSGSLLRPHAFLMKQYEEQAAEILDAAKKAGVQLIKDGKMSEDNLDVISKPLLPEKDLRELYNKMYQDAKNASLP